LKECKILSKIVKRVITFQRETMFRKNTKHIQGEIFGFKNTLPRKLQRELYESEEYKFYELIFSNIKEEDFASLYSEKESRPNSPVNSMVSALILQQRNNWTYRELFKQMSFNLLTKTALGIKGIEELPFCMATIFYFQNKLNDYYIETGKNLLEKVFDNLTKDQIKELKIKTNIQRTDSLLVGSNIRNYTRLQLLVEVLLRLYRELSVTEKGRFKEELAPYTKKTSERYIYDIKGSDIPHETEKLGALYYRLYEILKYDYIENTTFQIFARVYGEHFKIIDEKIEVKPNEELNSSCIQSPDDIEATYRKKNGKVSKGQTINVFETANPENPIELLTDISVHANNVDDSKELNNRIDKLAEKTPEIEEIHSDAAYGSSENDKKLEELGITSVQTAIRGPEAAVEINIEEIGENQYRISCPNQTVISAPAKKRNKAEFEKEKCKACPFLDDCSTIEQKECRAYYFTREDYLKKKRFRSIDNIPVERRSLRNNVEATISEFSRKLQNKKLKVRGFFKATIFAFTMAISINFGRIFRYMMNMTDPNLIGGQFVGFSSHYVKEQSIFLRILALKLIYAIFFKFRLNILFLIKFY
jgi:hypothetical protein